VLSALRERDGVLAGSDGKERDAASDGTGGARSSKVRTTMNSLRRFTCMGV